MWGAFTDPDTHLECLLGVYHLINALSPHLGQPTLHRLGLLRRDGLDDAEDALKVSRLGLATLAVRCNHFNRGTNCTPLGIQFRVASAHTLDILFGVLTVG